MPTRVLVNVNSLLAYALGRSRDPTGMKARVKAGYEGEFTDHVSGYDDQCSEAMSMAATELLEGVDLSGEEVLDVGCGTGIVTLEAVSRGAAHVVGVDFSNYMLERAREKAAQQGLWPEKVAFRQVDAESLPFADATFDTVLAGLVLSFLPDKPKPVAEMVRVVRPGGRVIVSAQGPEYLWEAMEAAFLAVNSRHMLAYRPEWWPKSPGQLVDIFERAGFTSITLRRSQWKRTFATGGDAWDFFAAASSAWWFERFPPELRAAEAERMRRVFDRKKVTALTEDIIVISAQK